MQAVIAVGMLFVQLLVARDVFSLPLVVEVPKSERLLEPPDDPVEPPGASNLEGDIRGIDKSSFRGRAVGVAKNGVMDSSLLWPNAVVPYVFTKSYDAAATWKLAVLRAMDGFHNRTCVRFVPRTDERDYLLIGGGVFTCASYVGRQTGQQPMILTYRVCPEMGAMQHELMHALGFFHEQSRIDRDAYVEINNGNIAKGNQYDFLKYINTTAFGQPYDFGSVLHYGTNDFAVNQSDWTIRPLPQYAASYSQMGQREGLSRIDIAKVNLMYKCGSSPPATTQQPMPPAAKHRSNSGSVINSRVTSRHVSVALLVLASQLFARLR